MKTSPLAELYHPPSEGDMNIYATFLKRQLDNFLGDEDEERHAIDVRYNVNHATLKIYLVSSSEPDMLKISKSELRLKREFCGCRIIFNGDYTYMPKPMQRLYWLPAQALVDSDYLIVKTMQAQSCEKGCEPLGELFEK